MLAMIEVSVVIPTRNRPDNLVRLLDDLILQTYPLLEVIVVDSSDRPYRLDNLNTQFPQLTLLHVDSEPSVCIQRNIGIRKARAPYVFLCDDDITLPENYVELLMKYIKTNGAGVASGLVMQKEPSGDWTYAYPPGSFGKLLFAFLFQHSVWGSPDKMNVKLWQRPIYAVMKSYYKQKGNGLSWAGWPLITDFNSPAFVSEVYGLGASIIKRDWLLQSPYDEVLDRHGIGDNYGVAMGFPIRKAIHVVHAAPAYHHQSTDNRLESVRTYYRRVLALHYFLLKYERFSFLNRCWFVWSLIGNYILFGKRKDFKKATIKALKQVLIKRNPYLEADNRREKVVEVEC